MVLSDDDVRKVAHLARVAMSDDKLPDLAAAMSQILDLAEQMQAVNTDEIEPMAHPLDLAQRLRDDEVSEPNQREAFQAIAPLTQDGLYLVPKVIE